MEEDFVNQGQKLQKLDYSQLVFLQVNRINNAFTTFYSGVDYKTMQMHMPYFEQNLRFSLFALEPMIFFHLSENERENYLTEKKEILGIFGEVDYNHLHHKGFCEWYALLMKYLAKSGIMPAKRRTLETLEE